MDLKDLRIGNFVSYKGNPVEVHLVARYEIIVDGVSKTLTAKDISPLPIEDKYLNNFVKGHGIYQLESNYGYEFNLYPQKSGLWKLTFWDYESPFEESPIAFLNEFHRLQNIIWSLKRISIRPQSE